MWRLVEKKSTYPSSTRDKDVSLETKMGIVSESGAIGYLLARWKHHINVVHQNHESLRRQKAFVEVLNRNSGFGQSNKLAMTKNDAKKFSPELTAQCV